MISFLYFNCSCITLFFLLISINFSNDSTSWTYARAIQQGLVKIAEIYDDSAIFMGEDMEIAGAVGMNIPLKNKGQET